MANGSLENSGGTGNRAGSWDHADGLGWQLWRRASFTSLSSPALQRYLARSRRNFAKNRVPLLADIQRRWASSGYSFAAGLAGDLPLFWGYYPTSHTRSRPGDLQAWPGRSLPTTTIVTPAAPGLARLSRAPSEASTSGTGTHAGSQTAAVAPERVEGADGELGGTLSTHGASSRVAPQARRGEIVSRAAIATTVAGAIVPPRVPMVSRLAVPLNRGIVSRIITPGAGRGPLSTLRRAATFETVWKESDLHSATSHATFPASPPSIVPAKIIGAPPQSQRSTVSTASFRDNETIRREVEDSTAKRSIGGSEQIIVSRSVAHGPRAAAATIDGGLPAAKSGVAASSIETQSTAPESGTAGARAPIGGSEITVAVPQRPIAGAAVTPSEAPIGVLRWTAFKPVSQPRVDAVGTKIFASVNGTMITRMRHFVFGSAPRNLQQVDDSMPSAALPSAVARTRIVTGSSGMPSTMPSRNIQTPRPDSTTAFSLGEIHKVEPPALAKSARLPHTENLRNVTPQTTLRVSGASVENEKSIHHKIVAGPLLRGVDLPAAQPSIGEEVKLAGNWQLQRGGAPSTYRTSGFAEGYVGTIFKRGGSSIVSRWSAMPLSIGSVNAGGNRYSGGNHYFGGELPRVFADNLGPSGRRVPRVAAEGLSGGLGRGSVSEAGKGVTVSSGGVSHAVQTQEASANYHGIYPLFSRTGSESLHGSSGSPGPLGTVPSVHGDGYGIGLADAYGPSGFVARIFRKSMSVVELGRNPRYTLPISPRRSLPLIRGGLLFRYFPGASDLQHVDAPRVAAPWLLARSPAIHSVVSDSLPDTASPPQGMQSFHGFSTGMSQSTTSEVFLVYPSLPAGPMPVLLSTKVGAPNLLRSSAAAKSLQEPFGISPTRETSYDMPLATRAIAAPDRQSTIVPSLQGAALRDAAQQTGSLVSQALPISGGAESANTPGETPAAGAQQKIDLDEIVEKAWQKLMRKLTIEQERRGGMTWR